jgi:transcriptional regulator with XRE-family HTH domain
LEFYEFSEEELNTFYSDIGANVKKFRERRGYTQMQLALAIGHNSVGHVAKAELHKYNKHFSLEQIYKIAKILQISPSTLLH